MDDFSQLKIVWSETNDAINTKIAFVPGDYYLDKTCFFLTSKKDYINFVYKVLSSNLFTWYMLQKSPRLGQKGISLTKETVELFPICSIIDSQKDIYDLYHLTTDEINYLAILKDENM